MLHRSPEAPIVETALSLEEHASLFIPEAYCFDDVLKQWTIGNPEQKLFKALRLWTVKDRRPRKLAATYSKRKSVMTEYEFLGPELFLEQYNEDLNGIRGLETAIKIAKDLRKIGENGGGDIEEYDMDE